MLLKKIYRFYANSYINTTSNNFIKHIERTDNMNILFIVPNFPKKVQKYLILPSLELTLMSAMLKKNNHNCDLIDMRINNYEIDMLNDILDNYKPGLICIESCHENHSSVSKIIEKCKQKFPQVPVALRGEIATFLPKEMLERNSCLDFVMRYDNEYTILNLVNNLTEGKNNFSEIGNLAYRDSIDKSIIINELSEPIKNLDILPYPDRELYDIKKYLQRDSETIVRSSRGCPGKCSFCIKTKLSPFRIFSIKRFCDEIEQLQSYGFESFFFSDDTFAFSDKRVKEFYDEIKRRGLKIKWTSNIRIKDINEYKIKLMKEIGAYRVFVGIETINSNSSMLINKNITKEEMLEKIDILKKYNLEFHASFILGSPGDSEEDLEETCKFLKSLDPTLVTFNQIKPFPGTDLYLNPNKYEIIMEDRFWFENDDWTDKAIFGTKKIPPNKVQIWGQKLLKQFIQLKPLV